MEKPDELWLHKDVGSKDTWLTRHEPINTDESSWKTKDNIHVGLDLGRDYFPWLAPGTAVKLQVTSVCKRHPGLDEGDYYPTLDEVDLAIRTLQMVRERINKERKGKPE